MRALAKRGARVGVRAVERALTRIEDALRDEVPGDVDVEREGERIVLTGRALGARSLRDPRFCGLGAMLRSRR